MLKLTVLLLQYCIINHAFITIFFLCSQPLCTKYSFLDNNKDESCFGCKLDCICSSYWITWAFGTSCVSYLHTFPRNTRTTTPCKDWFCKACHFRMPMVLKMENYIRTNSFSTSESNQTLLTLLESSYSSFSFREDILVTKFNFLIFQMYVELLRDLSIIV